MHLIRRTALRAASSSPSSSILSRSRSINTSSPFALRSKAQSATISPSLLRRFASDDASSPASADGESSSVSSAIGSAAESASTYASEAAESLTSNAEQAKESFVDTAAGTAAAAVLAFQPRENRRESAPFNSRGFGERSDQPRDPRKYVDLVPTPDIYIGNLLFDITAADLEREFGQFGPVKRAVIATDPRGMSKGFGYVEYETIDQATTAIEAKHQQVYEGRRLIVNYVNKTRHRAESMNPPSKTLFIGNLAFEMSDADLNKLFRDIRNVLDVRVAIDRRTGQPRGFAHADFMDVESATKGLEALKGQEIYGRRLRVDYSVGPRERGASRGDGSSEASF